MEAKKTRKVNALALEGKCRVVEVVFRIIQRQFKGIEADDVLERVDARTLQLNRPGFVIVQLESFWQPTRTAKRPRDHEGMSRVKFAGNFNLESRGIQGIWKNSRASLAFGVAEYCKFRQRAFCDEVR